MASFDAIIAPAAAEKQAAGAVAETANNSNNSRRDYIAADLEEVRAMFPAPMIQAANTSFVQVVVM